MRAGRTLRAGAVALLLAGCASFDPAGYRSFAIAPAITPRIASAPEPAKWHGLPLETGQLIVIENPGATSLFLSLITHDFAPYLHIGMVALEAEEPYVYEAMGAILPLPWAKPNAHMRGGVQRVKLENFLKRGGIIAIYDPPANADRGALADFARARWREHFPFDGQYDANDPSKFYCVEFIARALESAGVAPFRPTPMTRNPSVRVALEWLDIRSEEMLTAGTIIARERRVALISRGLTESEIERYFVLKREVHRRFTPDQRLGNVMFWRGQQLRLRPRVDEYFEAGILTETDPAILADRIFGAPATPAGERVATAEP